MPVTRRSLLRRGALLVATSLTAPAFVTRTALALDQANSPGAAAADPSKSRTILVVVQLSGGNDGLNTVVPFSDPRYAALRPTLKLGGPELLPLNDSLAFNASMASLKGLYDQGKVGVVLGVGYPNPERSHFRSMDIWHTARPDVFEKTGWLGRFVDACQCGQEAGLPGLSLGDQLNPAFWTDVTVVPTIASIPAYTFLTDNKYAADRGIQLQTLKNVYGQAGNWPQYESLIRRGTLNALAGSAEIQRVAGAYATSVAYPTPNPLSNQLKTVAQVINGDLGTRVFSVKMGGFDTHANERVTQANLLRQFSEAVDAFMQDLAAINRQDDVVILAFSEFGRRAAENGSGGTDHGTAEPIFVVGNAVQGGLHGSQPSLAALDRVGDMQFTTDFRRVYASLLQDHLGLEPSAVLGGTFEPLPLPGARA